jgi:hypothetical protein
MRRRGHGEVCEGVGLGYGVRRVNQGEQRSNDGFPGDCFDSLSLCKRDFQDLLKVRPSLPAPTQTTSLKGAQAIFSSHTFSITAVYFGPKKKKKKKKGDAK